MLLPVFVARVEPRDCLPGPQRDQPSGANEDENRRSDGRNRQHDEAGIVEPGQERLAIRGKRGANQAEHHPADDDQRAHDRRQRLQTIGFTARKRIAPEADVVAAEYVQRRGVAVVLAVAAQQRIDLCKTRRRQRFAETRLRVAPFVQALQQGEFAVGVEGLLACRDQLQSLLQMPDVLRLGASLEQRHVDRAQVVVRHADLEHVPVEAELAPAECSAEQLQRAQFRPGACGNPVQQLEFDDVATDEAREFRAFREPARERVTIVRRLRIDGQQFVDDRIGRAQSGHGDRRERVVAQRFCRFRTDDRRRLRGTRVDRRVDGGMRGRDSGRITYPIGRDHCCFNPGVAVAGLRPACVLPLARKREADFVRAA